MQHYGKNFLDNLLWKDGDYSWVNERIEKWIRTAWKDPKHLLFRHQTPFPEALEEGQSVASGQSIPEQVNYLNHVRYYAEKDHDLFHGRKTIVTQDGYIDQEGYIDWTESLARHHYLLKKLAEDEHRILNNDESGNKLEQAKQEYEESVSNLTEALEIYADQRRIKAFE